MAPGTASRRRLWAAPCVWGEQQVGEPVDGHPVALLGPRHRQVEAAQPRLDVRERQVKRGGGPCPAERARRVALDNDHVGQVADQHRHDRALDAGGMLDRVGDAGAIEPVAGQAAQAMMARAERGMLAGQQQARGDADRGQGVGQRCELDRFRTSTDDELDAVSGQRSPCLRRSLAASAGEKAQGASNGNCPRRPGS